jgi:hypothetical protein
VFCAWFAYPLSLSLSPPLPPSLHPLTKHPSATSQWKKLAQDEDRRKILIDWFEKKEERMVVLIFDLKGAIEPHKEFPAELRSKGVYFIKPK